MNTKFLYVLFKSIIFANTNLG